MEKLINKLNQSDPLHWCILYANGMRGNLVLRILAAHRESWWNNKLMNINSDPTVDLPLQLSENQSTFYPMPEPKYDFAMNYLAPHTTLNIHEKNKEVLKEVLVERQKTLDKYFFTLAHPKSDWEISRYIHIFASEQNSKRPYKTTKPVISENVINVDISKLFSYDRRSFEDEYCKLLNIFEFTPMFASVRSFILQMLDREASLNKELITF